MMWIVMEFGDEYHGTRVVESHFNEQVAKDRADWLTSHDNLCECCNHRYTYSAIEIPSNNPLDGLAPIQYGDHYLTWELKWPQSSGFVGLHHHGMDIDVLSTKVDDSIDNVIKQAHKIKSCIVKGIDQFQSLLDDLQDALDLYEEFNDIRDWKDIERTTERLADLYVT